MLVLFGHRWVWPMGRSRRARTRTRYLPEGFGKMSEMAILRHWREGGLSFEPEHLGHAALT